MKNACFLLAFMVCAMTNTLSAQPTMMGTPIPEGDHVPNELVVFFDPAPINQQKTEDDLLNEFGWTVEEWSPSGRYARVTDPNLDACNYEGVGNPVTTTEGEGEQVGLNYVMGTIGWEDFDQRACLLLDIEGAPDNYNEYFPGRFCVEETELLPQTGPGAVRVAIIDSGVQGPGNGTYNGAQLDQVIVPGACTSTACDPITTGITASSTSGFHPHGTYIASIISDWFRTNNMASQLSLTSYKVLDNDLHCTMFQVIKAIELATLTTKENQPHVISLSLGFRPYFCVKDPKGEKTDHENSLLFGAIQAAQEEDIIIVTSAGNDGNNLDVDLQYPAAEVGLNNLVTVGGLNCDNTTMANWSNYSSIHVDLFTAGAEVKVLDGNCYRRIYGTSFSCPIVAAKAAFHITNQAIYNDEDVLCDLRSKANPFPDAIYGIVDANANGNACSGNLKGPEDKLIQDSKAAVSPNPFLNRLQITLPDTPIASEAVLTLIDAQGKVVLRQVSSTVNTTMNLDNLKPGAYWLTIVTVTGRETHSVVKQ